MSRIRDQFLDTKGLTAEQLQSFGEDLAVQQRGMNWWIGDVARHAKYGLKLGDNYSQVFPEWMSPGLIQRCEKVALAYPHEADRNPLATWTQHMQVANRPDRIELVAAMVGKGQTSDQSAKDLRHGDVANRWLLAVDVHYFLHRFWYSGAGVESAMSLAAWVGRTVERLREKGLTDVVCCFDSRENKRKQLTVDWEDKYKDRPPKPPELGQQLNLVHQLLEEQGFACASVNGFEADDLLASYAAQFPGKVTLLTQDKDCRQCLSDKCNMLLDVEWLLEDTSGEHLPNYKWLSAKEHTEATGIPPSQWTQFQALMGDPTDGIKGAVGIGEKGAADLIRAFGTAAAAIEAAKADDERIPERKRKALIEFAGKLEVTLELVTLVSYLTISTATRV